MAAVEDTLAGAGRDERDRRQVGQLLAALIEAGRPSSRTLPLADGRRNFNELAASVTSSGQAGATQDRTVATPSGPVPVRVYRPAGSPDSTAPDSATAAGAGAGSPAVLFIHGGGWVFGDLDSHDGLCRALAGASGLVVVAAAYRPAPERPFPGPLEDCLAVAEWLAKEGAELGIDGTRLAVAGDSSGANLAAALAAVARDAGGPPIAVQCLAYPATDPSLATASYTEYADDPYLSRDEMQWYWDQYTAPEQRADVRAAVARNTRLSGLPPAIVVTAGHDPLRDEGMAYAEALQAAGVPTTLHHYPEMPHGFLLYGHYLDRAGEVIAEIGAELATGLGAA